MSGISSIRRDWGDNVTLVRIITSDTLQTALSTNYILNQAANIVVANNGAFSWLSNDLVLISASNGSALCAINASFSSLLSLGNGAVSVSSQLAVSAAQWNGMYAAPILLAPAPGANQLLLVKSVALALSFNSASYAAGGAVAVQYKNTVQGGGVAASASIAAATINALAASTVEILGGVSSVVLANAAGQGLYLSNATGAFTTGDSPWIVTVNYDIIQVS